MSENNKFILGVSEDINITESAVKEIKNIMDKNNVGKEFVLRIGVRGGGCSGFNYTLGFDSNVRETDNIIEKDGIKIVIDMKSIFYLTGTELDYIDNENGKGFIFNNPNQNRGCGCGSASGCY